MQYKIAIVSHRRPSGITKTLNLLKDFDRKEIYIFVSDEKDYKEYSIHNDYNIVYQKDLNGLKEKHNFILDYFEEGERIIIMEDDIEAITKKKGGKTENFIQLDKLFTIGFAECIKSGCKMWGIEPTNNGFYMKDSWGKTKKLIVAYIFGLIVDKRIRITSEWKHDYERTALHNIYFGGSIRFDSFSAKTNSFNNEGGLLSDIKKEQRAIEEQRGAEYLSKKYPEHIAIKVRPNHSFESCRQIDLRIISK